MTKDQAIALLQFLATIIGLAATMIPGIPDTLKPWLVFAVAVINAALAIFFGVVQPIAKAFLAGRAAALAEKSAKSY
jgi:hypothetical protein